MRAVVQYDRVSFNSADQLTGHLILLGGADNELGPLPQGGAGVLEAFQWRLSLAVRPNLGEGGDEEFDNEFIVAVDVEGKPTVDPEKIAGEEVYRPRFLRDETRDGRPRVILRGTPQLTADLAYIYRSYNPFNPSAKLTVLSGVFSRGTYGAVRAFTDAKFRIRNEQWLSSNLDPEDFWILFQVPVFADNTITADLSRAANRLRMSS